MAEVAICAVGALLADRARAAMLLALAHDNALPASELAARAGVTPGTASAHLNKLLDAGWLTQERYGRHHYYRLVSPEVAALLEAAGLVHVTEKLPRHVARNIDTGDRAIRIARTCYDHLAGRLGVAVTDDLLRRGALEVSGGDFRVTEVGRTLLRERFDIDAALVERRKRSYARRCLDWTERRDHLAGALGAAMCAVWLERGWVRRCGETRALEVTPEGAAVLRDWGIAWLEDSRTEII